jgi:hypothetical protein
MVDRADVSVAPPSFATSMAQVDCDALCRELEGAEYALYLADLWRRNAESDHNYALGQLVLASFSLSFANYALERAIETANNTCLGNPGPECDEANAKVNTAMGAVEDARAWRAAAASEEAYMAFQLGLAEAAFADAQTRFNNAQQAVIDAGCEC